MHYARPTAVTCIQQRRWRVGASMTPVGGECTHVTNLLNVQLPDAPTVNFQLNEFLLGNKYKLLPNMKTFQEYEYCSTEVTIAGDICDAIN